MNSNYIPRKLLFGNPDIRDLKISPDGRHIAYLAEHHGVLNIWAQDVGNESTARPLTHDTKRGIFSYDWTFQPGTLIFSQDIDGDENFGLYTLNVLNGETTEITPPGHFTTHVSELSHLRPDEVVILTNNRDPMYFDYKILDLRDKTQKDLFTNTENFALIHFDKYFRPVIAIKSNADGSYTGSLWNPHTKSFFEKFVTAFEDSMSSTTISTSNDGRKVYLLSSEGRDKATFQEWDLATDTLTVLAEDSKSDIQAIQIHPGSGKPLMATSYYVKARGPLLG
ncbi:MAG TPA: WD40 repeat domain-containing protein [Pseudobdellovibrionaceae bacterium]|jgi:hypothetical protein